MKLILSLLFFMSVFACNLYGPSRFPAAVDQDLISDDELFAGKVKLDTIHKGILQAVENSPILTKLNYFNMDPVTRMLTVNLTIDYPLNQLVDFGALLKDQQISNEHNIELAISFDNTKTTAFSKFLGIKVQKFMIDGEDHLDAFEIVLSVIQTVLANSDLIDYLYLKTKPELKEASRRDIVREMLDSNTIVPLPMSNKIKLKLDLAMFKHLSPFIEDYEFMKLWRFAPRAYKGPRGETVVFEFIAGEGKPSKKWLQDHLDDVQEDTRTILQVRNDLYNEYSNIDDIKITASHYLKDLLKNEGIVVEKLQLQYQDEVTEVQSNIISKARNLLNRKNDNFIANPEYEFMQFLDYSKSTLRSFVADLDRRLSIDARILAGGDKKSSARPLVTKLVSQDLLNRGMKFVMDIEVEGEQAVTDIGLWLLPRKNSLLVKGKAKIPWNLVLGNLDKGLLNSGFESKLLEDHQGYPFELALETKMADEGKLGLDISHLKFTINGKDKYLNRLSKTNNFIFDFTKMLLAQTVTNMDFELEDQVDEDLRAQNEMKEIISYMEKVKTSYTQTSYNQLLDVLKTDFAINPFINAGQEHVLKKKKILLGDLIEYNPISKLLEIKMDPNVAIDKINNVQHGLQIWGVTPIYSKELDNTFLELAIGKGLRSQSFIDEMYTRSGKAENSQFGGIYYDLGKEENTVDMLLTLNIQYLQNYANYFLNEMIRVNKVDLEKQAKDTPGEMMVQIDHMDMKVTPQKTFLLDMKVSTAKYARTWRSAFLGRDIVNEDFTIQAELALTSKQVELKNTTLDNLIYYNNGLKLTPIKARIKAGKASFINKALTKLISSATKLAFNNKTANKVLLWAINKFMNKMYLENNMPLVGSEMEKFLRVKVINGDILLFLNPSASGPSFSLQFAHHSNPDKKSIVLDYENQTLSIALSSGASMAKVDKKQLISIVQNSFEYTKEYREAKSLKELQDLYDRDKFELVERLVTAKNVNQTSLYFQLKNIITSYDQVFNVTKPTQDVKFAKEVGLPSPDYDPRLHFQKLRISPTGAELIHVVSAALALKKNLKDVLNNMNKFNFKYTKKIYLEHIVEILDNNIIPQLISEYERKNKQINETILRSSPSYWTYQLLPDAFMAQEVYKLIKQNQI